MKQELKDIADNLIKELSLYPNDRHIEIIEASLRQAFALGMATQPMRYGDDKTIHRTDEVNVELWNGEVVSVWFRCMPLKFTQHEVDSERGKEMCRMYKEQEGASIRAIIVEGRE